MESNQQYALYDGEAGGLRQWVAHVRLTPELLQRLQQKPESVTIQLQAPSGGSSASVGTRSTRTSTAKLNSVLTIDDAEPETYEMLSFVEDPKVNAVCAFRPDRLASRGGSDDVDEDTMAEVDAGGGGFSLYEVGRVFQKLIVQRRLDSTEKDRMKDRHAQLVLESKARSSKFVSTNDADPTKRTTAQRKMLTTRGVALPHPPGQGALRGAAKRGAAEEITPLKRRKLKSALTAAAVLELQERIAKGGGEDPSEEEERENDADESEEKVTEFKSSIFSSESEADRSPEKKATKKPHTAEAKAPVASGADASSVQPRAESKEAGGKELAPKKAARKAAAKSAAGADTKTPTTVAAKNAATSRSDEMAAEAKPSQRSGAVIVEAKPAESITAVEEKSVEPIVSIPSPTANGTKRKANEQDHDAPSSLAAAAAPLMRLKPVKVTSTETKKRARPRLNRLPDISFLPQHAQDICKRVSAHITRTAILDESDFDSFAAEHDRLRGEWEQLDKAYSIETIVIDGAHFQLPFASSDEEKQSLRQTIRDAEKKREGLQFVRDTMATIHKILASLQSSISTYEQKTFSAPR